LLAVRKVSFWQHGATYLLYFVMLMNVFITTFGITAGPAPSALAAATTTRAPAGVTEGPSQQPQAVVTTTPASLPIVGRHNISDIMFA